MTVKSIYIAIFLLFISILTYQVFTERAPIFFSLNDPYAEYEIGKIGDHHAVFYRKGSNRIGVMIGASKVDIERYLGRRVKVQGNFRERPSNKQCIVDRCHQIFSNPKQTAVLVDIDQVSSWE